MAISIKTTIYSNFKGVDYSTDPSLVDTYRSPYAPNLISGVDGMPEKRVGWRILHTLEQPINGIFDGILDGVHYFVIHAGTKLYSWDGVEANSPVLIKSSIANAKSTGFYFNVITDVDTEIDRVNSNASDDANNDDTDKIIKGTDLIFVMTGTEFLYFGKTKTLTKTAHTVSWTSGTSEVYTQTYYHTTKVYTEALTCGLISDIAHIPLVKKDVLAADGTRTTTVLEDINLVQVKRKRSVICAWDGANHQSIALGIKKLNGTDYSNDGTIQVRYVFSEHVIQLTEIPSTALKSSNYPVLWYNFYAVRSTGMIYLKQLETSSDSGISDWADGEWDKGYTIEIIFSKTVDDYADRINKCTVQTTYGYNSNNRIFFTGNPDYPHYDWYSQFKDPTYIPDLNYSIVGSPSSKITGYLRLDKYLAVLKENSETDSTMYLRYGQINASNVVEFVTFQSLAGVGAISARCMGSLLGDPLFLSNTGIYGIATNSVTDERVMQNRSYYIDSKLTQESNLQDAISAIWNGYFLICVNGNCYLLDGKQSKSYKSQSGSDYLYECYHWNNIPATCFLNYRVGDEEILYFGTSDGNLCRFNTDIDTMSRFNDNGVAIVCGWATKSDYDGDSMRLKTLLKNGNAVTLKPYLRSSAKVYFRTDRDSVESLIQQVQSDTADIFSWEDIDFSRFTFSSNDGPQEISFKTKVKNYKRLQIVIFNDGLNEGFGIFGITKHYVTGNFAK